jgi:tight adherence protein C
MVSTALFFCLLFAGLFPLGLTAFGVPELARSGVVKSLTAGADARTGFFDGIAHSLAKKLAGALRLSEFSREELAAKLKALDMPVTPEEYTASAVAKAALSLVLIVPALLIFPMLALGVAVVALVIYFHEKNRADRLLSEKREIFDREVPRFSRALAENLEYNRDIISIFEKYREAAGSQFFRREIDKTVADAKISSVEEALIRFDERINSKYLSDIIRGLLGILNGSEGLAHFNMIVRDIKKEEFEILKRQAMRRPDKLRKWNLALFIIFIASIFIVIILDVIRQVQIFGSVG